MFFDNLQVIHKPGPILEETHYYPGGLTMSGISSKAAGTIQNKEKTFQGQRFDDDLGLNWVQFKWRNHDPQIGRFIEIDPLANEYVYNSTYAFSENKVIAHTELEGLESKPINTNNPTINAFISPSTTAAGQKFSNNFSQAGSVTVGAASGGVGFKGVVGPLKFVFGASGPQVNTTVTTGGKVTTEASVATAGAEAGTKSAKTGSSITFGRTEYSDGKL